jgi:dolichyl-phosphate beta-glucosyltransferase
MAMSGRAVSLVIPTFNSARYIKHNIQRALDYFAASGIDGEVIVADDGSSDGTPRAVAAADGVKVLALTHRGKGAALRAGVAAGSGQLVAFTDADVPYGLEPIATALDYVNRRGYHAVLGDRTLPGSAYQDSGLVRRAVSDVASFTFRTLVTGGIYDTQCGFKAFRGDVARELFGLSRVDGFAVDVELIYLLLKYRLDLKRIPVRLERNGPSSVKVVRDSISALRDIASIRLAWATGRYRSAVLERVLEDDLRRDALRARRAVGRRRSVKRSA